MSEIVEVKKIKADSWSGFKFYDTSSLKLMAVSTGRGSYKTGLDVATARQLEKDLFLTEGTLNPNSPFWKSYIIKIDKNGLKLDLSDPNDKLTYHVLKADETKVAQNQAELRTKSKAIVVMTNRIEEAKVNNLKFKAKKEAYKELSGMSAEDMRTYLLLIGRPADTASAEIIEDLVTQDVEKDPERFLTIWKDDRKGLKLFVLELANKNILTRNKSAYYNGEELLGYNMEETIKFLNEPKHSELLVSLKQRLKDASEPTRGRKAKDNKEE